MKKYLYIYKATLIENLSYIPNILLGFANFVVMIFIFLNLWEYMYSDSSQVINGYTMQQMVWYVLIGEVLWYGTRDKALTKQNVKQLYSKYLRLRILLCYSIYRYNNGRIILRNNNSRY